MDRSAAALATLMGIAGASHFAAPAYFRGMVLRRLPATPVVGVSGLLDIGAGVLVAFPATRRADGWATAALITAYLPVHIAAARRARWGGGLYVGPLGAAARILVNLGYIGWALRVATARTPPSLR